MIQFDEHIFEMGRNHQLVFNYTAHNTSMFLKTAGTIHWLIHIDSP